MSACPIIGEPKKLPEDQLPSNEDIVKYCNYLRQEKKNENQFEPSFSEIANIVASDVKKLFSIISVPTVSTERVVQLITAQHDKYLTVKKVVSNKRHSSPSGQKKINDYRTILKKLFDVSSCKCIEFSNCNCSEEKKVPVTQHELLSDQRTTRLRKIPHQFLIILESNNECTERLPRSISDVNQNMLCSNSSSDSSFTEIKLSQKSTSSIDSTLSKTTSFYEPSYRQKRNIASNSIHLQNRIGFKETALTSQRYNLSNRATAAVATSTLIDVGLITKTDNKLIIDKNKIMREKCKTQEDLKLAENNTGFEGVYFDGRKDNTSIQVKKGCKYFRQSIKEEHISLISEPDSNYIGHVTPISGQSDDIANCIFDFLLKNYPQSKADVTVIGCDGCPVNTGWKGGIIRRLEEKFDRPLQWVVCLLHLNELPLKHFFQFLDGTTSGPNSYKGPIGTNLLMCEKRPIVKYNIVDCDLPSVSISDLSNDQKYLLSIATAIQTGKCSDDLKNQNPGPLCHARWLTTANRLLRLYISTEKPDPKLNKLVVYILKVYVPVWFLIKSKSTIDQGPKHLFELLKRSRYMPKIEKKIIIDCLSRNAFFAFPENLVLAMLVDDKANVREFALKTIIKARESLDSAKNNLIRYFKLPALQINAKDYTKMINWNHCTITSPPVLTKISTEEPREILANNDISPRSKWEFQNFPCHTQAVERTVKLVTEVSNKVCGSEMRDGVIRSTLESRRKNPKFDNKLQYNV